MPPKDAGEKGNSLQQQRPGVHLHVSFSRNVKLVGKCERDLGLPHQLFVGVVSRKWVLTWKEENTMVYPLSIKRLLLTFTPKLSWRF